MGCKAVEKPFSHKWWEWCCANEFCKCEFPTELLEKCFIVIYVDHLIPVIVKNMNMLWKFWICLERKPGLSTLALPGSSALTEDVSSPKKLQERLVKQTDISLVEDWIIASHCKIQPTSLLLVCLLRKGAGRWELEFLPLLWLWVNLSVVERSVQVVPAAACSWGWTDLA